MRRSGLLPFRRARFRKVLYELTAAAVGARLHSTSASLFAHSPDC
jgi:hypothetical protein